MTGVRALLLMVLSFVVAVSVACGDGDESPGSSRLVQFSSEHALRGYPGTGSS